MDQAETIAFLRSGRAFAGTGPVEVVETHGALVFLCGDTALKLKRAATYDYMDLGTPARRREMIARELELNRPRAPQIYRDMLPVTLGEAGLGLGGAGEPVDWVLRMWRFPSDCELERVAARGALEDPLAEAIGEAVAAYHAASPVVRRAGRAPMAEILDELDRVFGSFAGWAGTERIAAWRTAATASLAEVAPLLETRADEGHVRRGHGDLHLRNLVLIDGRPVPFDALEFDEVLGTCDVLYDVAFLIMDLCHRALPRQASRVLDAWLRAAHGREDAGLRALPLFLSVRAAIRAMVQLQTDAARQQPGRSAGEVASYLDLACRALAPPAPCLVAVGGFSGSGKSVLARSLTPAFGAMPGAVLLSSDRERKAGRPATQPLEAGAYVASRRQEVYRALFGRAATLLGAGHAVLLDATFLDPSLREAAEVVARQAEVPFVGFFLDAPREVLLARVRARRGDASDADAAVLEAQLAGGCGALSWHVLDGSSAPDEVLAAARAGLAGAGIAGGSPAGLPSAPVPRTTP